MLARGDYRALESHGVHGDHICAFARTGPRGPTVTIVPRLLAARGVTEPLGEAYWGDTAVAVPAEVHGPFRDAFTGASIEAAGGGARTTLRVGQVLVDFPVALLEAA